MKLKKPKFWDYKNPNFFAYLLLPFSYLVILINFLKNKKQLRTQIIKTICIGNIYIGGTGKTPLSIKISNILNNLNYKTAFIKKNYSCLVGNFENVNDRELNKLKNKLGLNGLSKSSRDKMY